MKRPKDGFRRLTPEETKLMPNNCRLVRTYREGDERICPHARLTNSDYCEYHDDEKRQVAAFREIVIDKLRMGDPHCFDCDGRFVDGEKAIRAGKKSYCLECFEEKKKEIA